jgi:hypothetical protein
MTILEEYVSLFRRRLTQAINNPKEWYRGKVLYIPFTPAIYRSPTGESWVGDVGEVEQILQTMIPDGVYAAVSTGYMQGEYMVQLVREPACAVPSWS